MKKPQWQQIPLENGILREPLTESNRIILWLPGPEEEGVQHWERIANVPAAEIEVARGICSLAATAISARQKVQGFLGKLLERFRKPPEGPTWVLPTGDIAVQSGPRRTDLLLVWAENEAVPLDEARVKALWPQSQGLRKIGTNLFLVTGIDQEWVQANLPPPPPEGSPLEQADQLLADARQSDHRVREVTALTDLGLAFLRNGEAPRAAIHLEQALNLARALGDQAREMDVLGNLGLALLTMGQDGRALELLEQQRSYAHEAGDRFAEKLALENSGMAHAHLGNPTRAVAAFEQALTLANALGDQIHQADLHWFLAIQLAQLGNKDQAVTMAQNGLKLFEEMNHPQVNLLRANLEKYRTGEDAFALRQTIPRSAHSGFRTVPFSTHQKRLQKCSTCQHHTGVRCKLGNDFTTIKAWMPHERCPIGKWPS